MLNIDHQQQSSLGPRISFSNDFADGVKIQNISYKEAPVSADFEFSVSNFTSFSTSLSNESSADEIFFMGKLLPLKERTATTTTLRDELLVSDHVDLIPQNTRGFSSRWKDRFSMMRRSCNEQKKRDGCLESVAEEKCTSIILDITKKVKSEDVKD